MTDRAHQLWWQRGERASGLYIMPTDRKTSGVPFAVQHHQPFIGTRPATIAEVANSAWFYQKSVSNIFFFFFSRTYIMYSIFLFCFRLSVHPPPDISSSMVESYLKPNKHLKNQQMILNKKKPLQEQVLPSLRSSADVIITEEA
jgi:hypothetical protein